jgi:hypothetical protein
MALSNAGPQPSNDTRTNIALVVSHSKMNAA